MATDIPFAKFAYKRSKANTPEQILRNWIVEKDDSSSDPAPTMLLQRPGLTAFQTLSSPIRALYASNNAMSAIPQLFAVAGSGLYSLDGGTATLVGTLADSTGRVAISGNFDRIAIVGNGHFYLYGASAGSTANTFREVSIPDGNVPCDVTMINDYFVIAMTNGTYYWLVPGDDDFSGSTNPLHFATAQSLPDGLLGVSVLNQNLFFFGANSIEVWQPVANADQPFQRTSGLDFQRGCLSRDSIVHYDNSLIWVGDDGKVYRASNVPELVSSIGINERLKLRTGDPTAWAASYDGHLFYVLRVPGQGTFAFDIAAKTWSEFVTEGSAYWRPHVSASITDTVYVGDSDSGKIWTLSDSATDDGTLIRRTATGCIVVQGAPVRDDSFVADVGCSAACTWRLRWADADQALADQPWEDMAAPAGASALSLRRLGQALAPYRQFEIEVTDPAIVRFSSARIGKVWR